MEENTSLFSLSIDSSSKEHLTEAAKWARFLAIAGFVFLGLLVLAGLFASVALSRLYGTSDLNSRGNLGSAMGTTTAITYIFMALIYFFPLLYLFRFASAMRAALNANDQDRLNVSFQNLKACFRYVGILTVIGLAFALIAIIISLVAVATIS
jgi:uncharacterized membrane protein YjgN (DUF898 family)